MPEEIAIANPVLKESDPELAALRAQAQQADAEAGSEPSANETETRAPVTEEQTAEPKDAGNPDNSETSPETKPESKRLETKERERDEHGRFLPKDETQKEEKPAETKPEEKKDEAKDESKYEKAKKDAERLDRSWKALNEEKEQIRREREEFLSKINQERAQLQTSMQQRNGAQADTQYTAEDYEAAAKEFEDAGDPSLAQKARDAAKAIRVVQQQTEQQKQVQAFQIEYGREAQAEIEKYPEAGKEGTPLFKAIAEAYERAPWLWNVKGGFTAAREFAQAKLEAGLVSELKEKNQQLEAEVKRLTAATSIGGSGPTSPTGTKKFEDMSWEEQREHLRRQARQADMQTAA